MIKIEENKISKARSEHLKKLKPVVQKRINRLRRKRFKKFIEANLDKILIGEPKILIDINSEIKRIFKIKLYIKDIQRLFNYSEFRKKKEDNYQAYDLARNLSIRVCPYCNRQYTLTIVNYKDEVTRPQFDHFFSQEKYPLLALSFYNLIPSCSICNSILKFRTEFDLENYFHPYLDDPGEYFDCDYSIISYASGVGYNPDLKIFLRDKKNNSQQVNRKIQNLKRVFKIEEIYTGHSEEISDLLKIKYYYGNDYLSILANNTFHNLKPIVSENELYRMAFGIYKNKSEFHKRPFSKLKSDILKKLEEPEDI